MATKLVQKHFFKGTQSFELLDESVNVQIKQPFKKEESLTVMLMVLNSEPVISKSCLEFTSRVNSEPLLSFYLASPNAEEFNTFINLLKQKITDEYSAFTGMKSTTPAAMERNVFDEAPEFEDNAEEIQATILKKVVNVERIEESIEMLSEYMEAGEISSFISALEDLQKDPQNQELLMQVFKEFDSLGFGQGAVLNYAPYIGILLTDDS
ncbi:MAG: hypothetical protein GY694_19755 [Gammaproteobacteria bacterium]|nr:hypothetical protein [Gammaproteobacteria bacterium]